MPPCVPESSTAYARSLLLVRPVGFLTGASFAACPFLAAAPLGGASAEEWQGGSGIIPV
jgi:hypothetical protein